MELTTTDPLVVRVLVVEDDPDDFLLTKEYLQEARRIRFVPVHISHAAKAVSAMMEEAHDVCLMDYQLGGYDGVEILRQARQLGYVKPAIMLTGLGEDELAEIALSAGASDFLEKGRLDTSLLERTIRYAIERKRTENEILLLNASLEHRVEERTAELTEAIHELQGFAYTVAHDLRAPLRAVISTSRILNEDFADSLPPEASAELERQAAAATRLGTLIDDLLKYARLYRAAIEKTMFSLSELALDVVDDVRRRSPASSHIQTVVQPGMMACGDPRLVRLVVENLIENAFKFSPDGGTVEVGANGETYFVSDQGVGFEMEFAEKIFRPFERLVTEKEFPGTGIGLANASRIIKRHGGTLAVDASPGKGAKFFFTLPED